MNKEYTVEKDWTTEFGLRAVVIRFTSMGHRCGYVGVLRDSPLWGKGYSEQLQQITQEEANGTKLGKKSPVLLLTAAIGSDDENSLVRRSLDILVDVHGGITYASSSATSDYPVESSELWWFGYDCGHYGDNKEIGGQSLEYCIAECESMAKQLAELEAKIKN